jgi:hypothetical protein
MLGPMANLGPEFLKRARAENPKLVAQVERLDAEAHDTLERLLGRFDDARAGTLSGPQSALAMRVIALLHRPSASGLERLLGVLDYLDVDGSRVLDHQELLLAVEILELFCKADSVNDTLSVKELDMLHAVLRHLDTGGKGVLDREARNRLRDELWDPDAFMAEQKRTNPLLRPLLG